MIDALLILNAGSSSLKFSVFRDREPPELLLRGQLQALETEPRFVAYNASEQVVDEHAWPAGSTLTHHGAIEFLLDWGQRLQPRQLHLTAVGHRVVHGGTKFLKPVRVNDGVLADLETLVPLAPLHQPHNLSTIRVVQGLAPLLPQVACFDTSFHCSQPSVARQFALPRELTAAGIQRYGFHGLSYEFVASHLRHVAPQMAACRTVVAHLGNGASLCALDGGVSVATTMSFTPLDGLPMGTRCGAIDPGVLLYLMDRHGLDARALEQLLTYESGLLGVSGISSDMRALLERETTDPRAAEAIELFIYRISRELGSMAAALGGLDALVFTGGIGEHAPSIRARVCRAASWLGIDVDSTNNDKGGLQISSSTSRVSVWVIPTNEELMIARHTRYLLSDGIELQSGGPC